MNRLSPYSQDEYSGDSPESQPMETDPVNSSVDSSPALISRMPSDTCLHGKICLRCGIVITIIVNCEIKGIAGQVNSCCLFKTNDLISEKIC